MNSYRPEILLALFQELDSTYQRWSIAAGNATRECDYQLRLAVSRLREAEGIVCSAAFRAEQAKLHAQIALNDSEAAVGIAEAARSCANETSKIAQLSRYKADECLLKWRGKYSLAHSKENQCRAALKSAEDHLHHCHNKLNQAIKDLSRAESALDNCESYRDKEGNRKDCSRFYGQVMHLRDVVEAREMEVEQAHLQVQRAMELLSLASEDVLSCQLAVQTASTAVAESQAALARAKDGSSAAQESAALANQSLDQAKQSLACAIKLIDFAEIMKKLMLTSDEYLLKGRGYLTNAFGTSEGGANTVARMRLDLANATQALIDFNAANQL